MERQHSNGCLTPMYVKTKFLKDKRPNIEGIKVPVQCGKCPTCLNRRIAGWHFRVTKELERSTDAQFITLTYSTPNINFTEWGNITLVKSDLQNFFKKLRNYNLQTKIKYYATGEYGTKKNRPHYHVILFNAKIESIQKAWDKGQVHYDPVNPRTIGYVLSYIANPDRWSKHSDPQRIPEFSLMSKGLGNNYITELIKSWHHQDEENRMYLNIPGNKKIAMPRYYKDKIYSEYQRKRIAAINQRKLEEELLAKEETTNRQKHNQIQSQAAKFAKSKKQYKKTHHL